MPCYVRSQRLFYSVYKSRTVKGCRRCSATYFHKPYQTEDLHQALAGHASRDSEDSSGSHWLTTMTPHIFPKMFTTVRILSMTLSSGNNIDMADSGILTMRNTTTKLTMLVSGMPPSAMPPNMQATASSNCWDKDRSNPSICEKKRTADISYIIMPPTFMAAHSGNIKRVASGLACKISAARIATGKVATELDVPNAVVNTGRLWCKICDIF
jgi:hypothetical protein